MPTTDPKSVFGRIVTRRDVEQAVIAFLQTWVPTYVGEIERQGGLAPQTIPMPPDPNLSYRGGLDFNTWEPAWSPVFIVCVEPAGPPRERVGGEGKYLQQFNLKVACNFQLSALQTSLGVVEEDSARQYADMLAMAACAAMLQHGGLGLWPDGSTVSYRTWMTEYPRASFPFPDERRVVRSEFAVQIMVADVVTEADGPREPAGNPYASPGDWPTVETTGITVDAVPLPGVVPQTT